MFQRQFLPSLNLLKAFEAAGRYLSFKLAAEELFVTPSAVSQQIKTLEEYLGIELFIRKNRAIEFTSTGEAYWHVIHKSIETIHQHTSHLILLGHQELSVSLMPPIANRVVLHNLNSFNHQYPDINLRITSSLKNVDVLKGQTDVAVRFGIPPWPGVKHEKICNLYLQVVCPPSYTIQYKLDSEPENLRKMPLIHMSERPNTWNRWFKERELDPPLGKQHFLDDYPSAIQAAESVGAMLALIPLENELIKNGRLEAPFSAFGPIEESIYAVYKADSIKIEAIETFISWLKVETNKLNNI